MMLVKFIFELILELDNRSSFRTSKDSFGNGRLRSFTTSSSHNLQIERNIRNKALNRTLRMLGFGGWLRSR